MSELNLAMPELNLPIEMFEEIFNQMSPYHVIQLATINKNARVAASRIVERMVDAIYQQYATSYNIILTKRLNRFWAVQVVKSTSDSRYKMFYKVNLWSLIRTQISESRFIDMAYPQTKQ